MDNKSWRHGAVWGIFIVLVWLQGGCAAPLGEELGQTASPGSIISSTSLSFFIA